MKKNSFFKGLAAGVVLTLAFIAIAGFAFSYFSDSILGDGSFYVKLATIESLIKTEYLGDADKEEMEDDAFAGLVYSLGDTYSRYYTAEEYAQESSSTSGSYVGIGVQIQQNTDGSFEIATVYEGGPGEEAGLLVGDIVLKVDGKDCSSMELNELVSSIHENDGGSVTLTVKREGQSDPIEITAEVTNVELASVSYEMLDDKIGYIKIAQFTGVTLEQYETAFSSLKEDGMEKLIIDLRDNPGGLVTSVCSILEQILPEGIIVYTEDKDGNRVEQTCDGENELDMPLAVLVNGSSASASEIFAGAVKDYGIGTIVGTTTYGKGVVQAIYPLTDGSAVKLTISNYYTPNGNSINGTGIEPDVVVEAEEPSSEEKTQEEDDQLQKAIEVLHTND